VLLIKRKGNAMAPKNSATREEIIETAFAIVQQEGMTSLTVRNVAQKLGLSTRPVYSHFASMKDLQQEAMRKARELMLTYVSKCYTNDIFLNMGTGAAFFARDHKALYRILFMENNDFKDLLHDFRMDLSKQMKKDERFTRMTQKERDDLLNKMWIFTHGFASLICVGLIEEDSDLFIIETMNKVGSAVSNAAVKESLKHKNTVRIRRNHE
jgi:AcrR family transcriptional regulator